MTWVIVHGIWGQWGAWSDCDKPCGGGTRDRNRDCDDPKPAHNGNDCSGSSSEYEECNKQPCIGMFGTSITCFGIIHIR